jgi:uncharacterized protein YbgA (DUF1722 family)
MSACLSILKAWVVIFKQEYLSDQTLLEPHPEQLAELETAYSEGEGKNYWK